MKEKNYLEELYYFLKKENPDGNIVDGDIRNSYIQNNHVSECTTLDSRAEVPKKTETDKTKSDAFEKYTSSAGLSAEDVFGGGKISLNLSGADARNSDASVYRYSPYESRHPKATAPNFEAFDEYVPKEAAPSVKVFDKYTPKATPTGNVGFEERVPRSSAATAKEFEEYIPEATASSVEQVEEPTQKAVAFTEQPFAEQKTELSNSRESLDEAFVPSKKPSIFEVLKKYISVTPASQREQTSATIDNVLTAEDEKEYTSIDSVSDVPETDAVSKITDNTYGTELSSELRAPRSEAKPDATSSSASAMEFDKDYFVLSPSAAKRLKKDTQSISSEAEKFVKKYVSRPSVSNSAAGQKAVISSHGEAVTDLEKKKTSSLDLENEKRSSEWNFDISSIPSSSDKNAPSVTDINETDTAKLLDEMLGQALPIDVEGDEESVRDEEPIFDKNAAIRRLKSEIDDNDAEIMRYNAIIEKSKKSIRDSKKEYTKAKKEYDNRSFDALVADIITFLSAFFTVYFLIKWTTDRGSEVFRALFLVTLVFTAVMLPFTVLKNIKVRPYKKTMRRAKEVIRDSKTWIEESEREIRILKEERRDLKKQQRDYR